MVKPIYTCKDATELLNYAGHILKKMTENASLFPDPIPTMMVFEKNLNDYREAYAEATHRDMRAVVIKGQKGKELKAAVYRLSHYVDAVALGDAAIILAAGYRPSQSTKVSVGRTPKATGTKVKNMEVGSGVIRISVDPWKQARLYQYDYRRKGTEEWSSILKSSSMLVLDGLVKLQEYEFRVTYLGRDTTPNFSDIVTALVV